MRSAKARIGALVAAGVALSACGTPAKTDAKPTAKPVAPLRAVLPTGRLVRPAADRHFNLGDFPGALAISPNGRFAVAVNIGEGTGLSGGFGTFCDETGKGNTCGYVPSQLNGDPLTPTRDESLSVVDLRTNKVADVTAIETIRDPANPQYNFFAPSAVFNADGSHLYVVGGGNDSVYDFTVTADGVQGSPKIVKLDSTVTNEGTKGIPLLGAVLGTVSGYTKSVAVTPDGNELLVAKEYDSDVTVLDADTLAVKQVISLDTPSPVFGQYLHTIVVAPDGNAAYVSAQGPGKLWKLTRDADGAWGAAGSVAVGSHPTGVTMTPDGSQVLVANTNDDTLSVLDAETLTAAEPISLTVLPDETWGAAPRSIAVARSGKRAYVALAGDDSVAVLDRVGTSWKVRGFLPAGWYPTGVALNPKSGDLLIASAKGLGVRYPPKTTVPKPKRGGPQANPTSYYTAGQSMPGLLTQVAPPSGATLRAATKRVRANLRFSTNDTVRSAHNPIPAKGGDSSPIKHVIYVVRENRTFDQVFGDLGKTRKDVDADPSFELLAEATPNAHALQRGHATSDRFFSDGEASVQGHWWTAAANVNNYTEESWLQNYSNRNRPFDFVVPVAQPKGCTVFQVAQKKAEDTNGEFTYKDYGEIIGGLLPKSGFLGIGEPNKDSDPCSNVFLEHPDNFFFPLLGSFSDFRIQDLSWDDRERLALVLDDWGLDLNGHQVGDPAKQFLPNFSYLTLPQDHTTGVKAGVATPRAAVAQNDEALGQLVQAISHSKYWKDTAIIVVEDDSQDGPDHVDQHRNILLVISPWAKHESSVNGKAVPGFVSHQRTSLAGVVRTIGLIFGFEPMSSYEQFAPPLYDAFQDKNDPEQLTKADLESYTVVGAPAFINEQGDVYLKTAAGEALGKKTERLDLSKIDVAGPELEEILWRSVKPHTVVPAELRRRLTVPMDQREGDDDE